jgi:trimeric autotransporter adhesin
LTKTLYRTNGNLNNSTSYVQLSAIQFTPQVYTYSVFLYDKLFYPGEDANRRVELWSSSGSGGNQLSNLSPPNNVQYRLDNLFHNNGKLFFTTQSLPLGNEMYAYSFCATSYNLQQTFNESNEIVKYTVSDNITTSSIHNTKSSVTLDAGKSITLNSGFEIKSGAVFKAEIGGCSN